MDFVIAEVLSILNLCFFLINAAILFQMMLLTQIELYQVIKIDGRIIGDGQVGPVTKKLQQAYGRLTAEAGVPIPTYQSSEL